MGYGHSRAAYALRDLSGGQVLSANDYSGIPAGDRKLWKQSREVYETISRIKPVPIVGSFLFEALDHWQEIPKFYPRRDLSQPSSQVKQIYALIRRGWGKDLIELLNKKNIPLITTFFTVAFMAEEHGFKNDIYAVICDSDISRAWVAFNPFKSRIK